MYVVVAQFTAQEGLGNEVARRLATMIPHALQEPGCRQYAVNRSVDNPDVFLLYELYGDEAAFAFHTQTDAFKDIVLGQVVPLLRERQRSIYTLVEAVSTESTRP
jgi:quinol monooxygenase YgiN